MYVHGRAQKTLQKRIVQFLRNAGALSEAAASRPGEQVDDSIWKHPNLVLGAIGIFAYVGAEVSIGSFLVNYFGLPEIAGLSSKDAAGFVSFYWGGAMIGRFLGAGLLRRVKAGDLLALCAATAATLVVASWRCADTPRCGAFSPSGSSTRSCFQPFSAWEWRNWALSLETDRVC